MGLRNDIFEISKFFISNVINIDDRNILFFTNVELDCNFLLE